MQRVETSDKNYQYLLFAADPYEVGCHAAGLPPSRARGCTAAAMQRSPALRLCRGPAVAQQSHALRLQRLLLLGCPVQTISFKVPNDVVGSKDEGRYFAHWDPDGKVYSLQVQFKPPSGFPPPPADFACAHPACVLPGPSSSSRCLNGGLQRWSAAQHCSHRNKLPALCACRGGNGAELAAAASGRRVPATAWHADPCPTTAAPRLHSSAACGAGTGACGLDST